MSNKLMIFESTEKIGGMPLFGRKCHAWKKSGVTTQGRTEVEVGTLLLSNDENNVIAENILSYFSV